MALLLAMLMAVYVMDFSSAINTKADTTDEASVTTAGALTVSAGQNYHTTKTIT